MSEVLRTVSYALLPLAAAVLGSVISTIRIPGSTARSYVQHLAAGVVFSVVAVELLPEIMGKHEPLQVIVGFVLGVVVMFGIKHVTERKAEGDGSSAMLWAIGVDVTLDGLLIGVSFAEGAQAGRLLTIALSIELLSLALAMTSTLLKEGASKRRAILTTAGVTSMIVVGAALGGMMMSLISEPALEIVLSFGLAALLYLVTEELLIEAHEEKETPLATSMFFVGFLAFLILGMV